ncbi:16499_t:CDS:2 [Dentiscutata heterogama]|uniref:16499_t:CDS:1 n=1 Tax=Dentiscutata heterogama TaxID=1316150 RepID=A0ACA9KSD7_9GLOM|nr:16499_t:CDS:2 [Dentiscutata heterogama]
MPKKKKTNIADKLGFSYFITTPCESWDALEYHKEWCVSKNPVDKTTVTTAIMRQLEWNKRSLDVLKNMIAELNEASSRLTDFARTRQDAIKRKKQYHQLHGFTTPYLDSPILHLLQESSSIEEEMEGS